jgi:hypothetical protein
MLVERGVRDEAGPSSIGGEYPEVRGAARERRLYEARRSKTRKSS